MRAQGCRAGRSASARRARGRHHRRAELERDDYANGSTSELAARGLYGEYALFIPAEVLSIDGSDGLVLEHVDDILLRFDYVSVAR